MVSGQRDGLQDVMASIQTGLAKGLKMGDRQVRRAAYHNLQVSLVRPPTPTSSPHFPVCEIVLIRYLSVKMNT